VIALAWTFPLLVIYFVLSFTSDHFFTTKEKDKGTGLGLATVYGIVKQSGGNIWVYSEPEKGSTFKIYLPRVESAATRRVTREIAAAPGHGEMILVVEDEATLRKLFSRMIRNLGYQVQTARDGSEALLAVEQKGLRPNLVITDVVMPGMSGKSLAERLGGKLPDIKVLYVSGYTDNAIIHQGMLDPQVQFLQKPFNSGSLAAKIHAILNSS
jgi:two-component system cell cycle sensor histidine kinase/response regulator CckA